MSTGFRIVFQFPVSLCFLSASHVLEYTGPFVNRVVSCSAEHIVEAHSQLIKSDIWECLMVHMQGRQVQRPEKLRIHTLTCGSFSSKTQNNVFRWPMQGTTVQFDLDQDRPPFWSDTDSGQWEVPLSPSCERRLWEWNPAEEILSHEWIRSSGCDREVSVDVIGEVDFCC